MRKSYSVRPRMYDEFKSIINAEDYVPRTIYQIDPDPQPSGILNALGDMIYTSYELDPIGFYTLKERV